LRDPRTVAGGRGQVPRRRKLCGSHRSARGRPPGGPAAESRGAGGDEHGRCRDGMSGLRVLFTNVALAERTGSEMYVHDLALALAARGHTPLVYTPQPGPLAPDLASRGVEVRGSLADFSAPPDIVHGQHTVPTISALRRFPGVPALYVCHDATARVDTPPIFPRILRHVAVDHNCRERVVKAGVPPDRIRVVYNSVDLPRFTPRPALPARPSRALLFSNYADERTHLRAVREACARAQLPLDVVGLGVGTATPAPE